MRDAHQSLLATRMRTRDIAAIAGGYSKGLPGLLSLECWGGATFDVAMRFLGEDPWERLAAIRERVPNILLQMLARGANGVGYTNYPDNTVKFFTQQAARNGMDLFRVFDCFNWVENMRVTMDTVLEEGKLCEAVICYTGDLTGKYDLTYYTGLAEELTRAGAHIIAVKDMAGLMKPAHARKLFPALRDATDLPIHFHTHDTSGIAAATVLAAVEAGVDAIDCATDAMAGGTSQPALGSVVAALEGDERAPDLDIDAIRRLSLYWEGARAQYAAFETDTRAPASEVYEHEMPGGQYTNLKEQARSMGLGDRWHEVSRTYADVNDMFGDIIKVTPSSKVVGDMTLMMVSQGLTRAEVEDPDTEIAFPDSVVAMMKGELSQPVGGFPEGIQRQGPEGRGSLREARGRLSRTRRSRRRPREGDGGAGPQGERHGARLLPDVPQGLHRLRPRAPALRPGGPAAHARLFLRHAARRGDHGGDRARQDLGGPVRRGGRHGRIGPGARHLRAERPAAASGGPGPLPRGRGGRACQGDGRGRPGRRAHARRRQPRRRGRGRERRGGRRAAVHRGHEDGDRDPRAS